jgi:hypothetical protein
VNTTDDQTDPDSGSQYVASSLPSLSCFESAWLYLRRTQRRGELLLTEWTYGSDKHGVAGDTRGGPRPEPCRRS